MTTVLVLVAIAAAAVWGVAKLHLEGDDLSRFDGETGEHFAGGAAPSAEVRAVVASLANAPSLGNPAAMRRHMDAMFADRELPARFTDVDGGGVPAQWVAEPGADGSRRMLYLHGGAFTAGSPRSHRTLTSRFAEVTGGAVLAIDYRLMPEHSRMAGIEDCRRAYRWMLEHGPDRAAPAAQVFVAGDSAGGNLALTLTAWLRDQGLRVPDAVIALSPITDSTFASPSLKANLCTDPMLGPLFAHLARVPRTLLLWGAWMQNRINPSDPLISPLRGDLSRLPPVLVQAAAAEMLVDDSRRYVNRAQAAGSPVRLQTWDHMVHVWQIFNPELSEARAAFEQIDKFLAEVAPPRGT